MKLFIIGSGFDIACGFNLHYSDFKKYLIGKYKIENEWDCYCLPSLDLDPDGGTSYCHEDFANFFVSLMNRNILNDDGLWQNFEDMLGEIDYSEFEQEEEFYFDENSEIEDMIHYANINEDIAKDMEYIIKDGLDKNFRDWIEETFNNEYPENISKIKKSLEKFIDDKSLFLNFNYTLTLESYLNINRSRICHIHNSIYDLEDLIVGHHNIEREFNEEEYEIGFAYYSYEDLHKKLVKPTIECLNKNKDFFDRLKNVSEIFFYGFSFSDADLDYIKKISDVIKNKHIVVHFTKYSKEKGEVDKFCNILKSANFNFEVGTNI